VADYKQFFNENLQWDISFTRLVHNWEVDFFTSSFDLLYSIRLREGSEDKYVESPIKSKSLKKGLFIMCCPFLPVPYFIKNGI
jgi:hypothetical protein